MSQATLTCFLSYKQDTLPVIFFGCSVYKEKKDTIPFETGEAKISATAVLYDDIEPVIELTFISHLRGTNEEDETKTTGNKQIIDSDLNS